MSIVYNTTLKNARLQKVIDAIDGGSGAGHLKIGTAGMGTVLANIPLSSVCGVASGGVLTFSDTPLSDSSADNTGTAAAAAVYDGSGTLIISGLTVGVSASDINLTSTSIVSGQPVTITSASITHG